MLRWPGNQNPGEVTEVLPFLSPGRESTVSYMLCNVRSLDYSSHPLHSQALPSGGPALFVPSHLLVTSSAHTTPSNSSREESEHLKIHRALRTTAAVPPEDETRFWAILFLSSLLNSHVSRHFFPNKSSVILQSFSLQSWGQQRPGGVCPLLLCCLTGNVFQGRQDCQVLRARSLQNDAAIQYCGF